MNDMPFPNLVSKMSSEEFVSENPSKVAPDFAEEVVRHCLAEINQPVDPTKRLEELSLDSLTMVLVLISVEDALQVRFPDPEVERIRNLGEFVAVVARHTERKPAGSTMQLAKGA
jgi:acyl carrier protein